MIYYSSNSSLFKLPQYHSMWSCYQDDSFGNHITVELDSTQVILFITEDLH